ncbi:MAG: hypothetical protein U0835_18405 [Isosphaeraceae bacterium]
MDVRHGTLLNVYGKPVRHDGYLFMPADVALDGCSFGLAHRLCDHVGPAAPPVLRRALREAFETAWVRARIPALFGFTPDAAEVEKALIWSGFAAVIDDGAACYPFVCTDHYGRSALMFSDEGPADERKQSIASAFWRALLLDPEDLADFEQRVYHPGASVWLEYGCDAGRVSCEESSE